MQDDVKLSVFNEIATIFKSHTPMVFDAISYFETNLRTYPQHAFTELRDVVSHLYDLVNVLDQPKEIEKNITEIKQHFRRGISETYQLLYDTEMSYQFQYYGKYKRYSQQYEKLLFLRKVNKPKHVKIQAKMKEAQNYWIEARRLKNNDLDTPEFKQSIEKFKEAYNSAVEVKDDINDIWNDFNQRSYILLLSIIVLVIIGIISAI